MNVLETLEKAMVEHVTPTFPGSPHRAVTAVRWYLNNDPDCKKGLLLGIKQVIEEVLKEAVSGNLLKVIPEYEDESWIDNYSEYFTIDRQKILDVAKQVKY